jgi:tetratricopeptide (TPR) repeat protein
MRRYPPNGNASDTGPEWRHQALDSGILSESTPDCRGRALWVPAGKDHRFLYWERISSAPSGEFTVEPGINAAPATSVRMRQSLRGFLGRVLRGFSRGGGSAWVLPTGERVEPCGERQSDLLLVWAENQAPPLDESRIRVRWPQSPRVQRLGDSFYLVAGVKAAGVSGEAESVEGCPNQLAERALAAARRDGDCRREVTALTDLGLIHLHGNDASRAVALLEEALAVARPLNDQSQEGEVLGSLGLALLTAGQPQRAAPLLEQALAWARAAGDPFGQKATLEWLGLSHARAGQIDRAIALFEEALALARAVGHRKHEADLLWHLAIQYAELGQRAQAVSYAHASVELMRQAGDPQAAWFAEHLHNYRVGAVSGELAAGEEAGSLGMPDGLPVGSLSAEVWADPGTVPRQPASSPGLLRMALSATKSLAQFLGSGMKTVAPRTLQRRLRTCAACEQHTGLRCRLCGCFTNAKARMPHEDCPLGKWPAG